ncbi:MAG: acyl-CoA dehydrogenase family protein, partial [Pseudomonadota bacterium]
EAFESLKRGADIAAYAACAESVGAMQRLFETTVEYMKTRVQFGRPLAALQVVRHRIADMFIECEQSKSAVLAGAASSYDAPEWPELVAHAKRRVSAGADFLANQAVQLHGGIGVTDEYEVSHYFKRVTALRAMLGADMRAANA